MTHSAPPTEGVATPPIRDRDISGYGSSIDGRGGYTHTVYFRDGSAEYVSEREMDLMVAAYNQGCRVGQGDA